MKDAKLKKLCSLGLYLILSLYGCGSKFISGNQFSVMAELRNDHGEQLNVCIIELLNQDGEILHGPDSIPGKFHKIFIVAPQRADYLVNILCPGFKTHQNLVTYGGNVTPIKPLRLGVITMEPAQE